ncbi:MAG TPA: stage III sporulation protein AG [Bacillota bacterium]|nr:stage III sporulation protein AG [Bacillota bacterium]HRS21247.1 stage III sporulation protein AG [Clostridia bacterium]HRU41326.1 stage III sporulation protein AG [Candidatus Diapherotrites archaeon]HQI15659.1 stage III sporulation protein AG [Bacillota bacterium]HQJ36265.1 stage III sporulation protein AG [Bacillota bacterium]
MKLHEWLMDKLRKANFQKLNFSKKTTANLIIVFCLGLALILIADFYRDIRANRTSEEGIFGESTQADIGTSDNNASDYVRRLETDLSSILSKIQDAGRVSVMITLECGAEIIPAKDESTSEKVTNEKDTSGGTRIINEKTTDDKVVFTAAQGGNSKPLIIKEINPEVKGVIVVAEGAKDSKVKLKISRAVQTVLDIPAYKVTVYERN